MLQYIRGKAVDGKDGKRPDKDFRFEGSCDNGESARLVNNSLCSESPSSVRNRNAPTPRRTRAKVFSDEKNDDNRKRQSMLPLRRLEVTRQVCQQRHPALFSRVSTILLCASFTIWILCGLPEQKIEIHTQPKVIPVKLKVIPVKLTFQDRIAEQMKTRDEDDNSPVKKDKNSKRKRKADDLAPGCVRSNWHSYSFPNCNDIHEIDLPSIKARPRKRRNGRREVLGFIADGFWRDIWAVNPRPFMEKPAVLKIMKREHDVTSRNFDRHRRDGLAMERLSSSPYIVDIYGFCGNSVLTEYIPVTLEELIYYEDCPEDKIKCPTRETEEGRLQLALDMAQSLKAMHMIPGGPIVHADIHSGQFLIREDGRVVLNDFNRGRFMAHDNKTGELCTFRISSAPGNARSPEEYEKGDLDAKLDIFSLANILCGLFTERDPWEHLSESKVKEQVKNGTKPVISERYQTPGSTDKGLVDLTYRAYALDPRERISASELVEELEKLMVKYKQAS